MATNDTILIDGILDDIISSNGMDDTNENRGKAFEDFAISELLKNYDLTRDQIIDGLVDGSDDGGIDGLYFFVMVTMSQTSQLFFHEQTRIWKYMS